MSKSEKLLDEILLKLKSVNKFDSVSDLKESIRLGGKLKKEVKDLIMLLYNSSKEDNFYYLDCSLEVYKNTYQSRLTKYSPEYHEENEILFLKKDLGDLINPYYAGYKVKLDKFRFYCQNNIYNDSFNAKIQFIRTKLSSLGWLVTINPEVTSIPLYYEYSNKKILINFSYNPSFKKAIELTPKAKQDVLTSNQIVLLLQEIGFFTHPKIEDAPKTKQAELISKICGLTPKNIKSNIEKLDKSKSANGDNYQKDIDKINKILDDLA